MLCALNGEQYLHRMKAEYTLFLAIWSIAGESKHLFYIFIIELFYAFRTFMKPIADMRLNAYAHCSGLPDVIVK